MTPEQMENWFTCRAPDAAAQDAYGQLRNGARTFAQTIDALCPDSADKTAAIRKVREALMTANASIACGGK